MKLVCTKNELLKGIGIVSGAVSQKSTLPLLSNLLLDATGESLTLSATDLEIAVRTTIKAQILDPGGITLPAKMLTDIVRKTAQDEIEITSNENNGVVIKSGKAKYSLVGISKEEFPEHVNFDESKLFELQTEILKEMIVKTKFAVSTPWE